MYMHTHTLYRDRDSVCCVHPSMHLSPTLEPSTVPGKHGVGVGDEAGFDSHVGAQRGLKG